jgi:BASS family bile acid:Na+ symporter
MDAKDLVILIAQISLVLIVASAGMKSEWRDLECALKRPDLLLRAIVAVNIVVPLAAMAMVLILPIEPVVKLGIVVMAVSPLAPLVPGRLLKVGAQPSAAVGLYFAMILLAVLIVPATVALLSAIYGAEAAVSPTAVLRLVFTTILLPLLGGILISSILPRFAPRLATIAAAIGNLLIGLFVILYLYIAGGALLALVANGTLLACAAIVVAALAGGHWLGGPEPTGRIALAIAAATRHPGIAVLIARSATDDPRATLTIMLFLLVSVVISTLYQIWATRRLRDDDVLRPPNLHPVK